MSTKQYEMLISQLNTVGMENVVYMDPALKSFHISIRYMPAYQLHFHMYIR